MTHPGAREHVRNTVGRIANEWGYRLFKLDGFWTGSATRQVYVNDGIVDLSNERWNAANGVLSGTSEIVANDPHELRIVVPAGKPSWRAKSMSATIKESNGTIKAELRQDGPLVRASILNTASREVNWLIQFEPAPTTSSGS